MDLTQRFCDGSEVLGSQEFVRKNFGNKICKRFDIRFCNSTHLALRYTVGQAINGQDLSVYVVGLEVQRLHTWMTHLPTQTAKLGFTGKGNILPDVKLLGHKRLVEPDATQPLVILSEQDA